MGRDESVALGIRAQVRLDLVSLGRVLGNNDIHRAVTGSEISSSFSGGM
jgi:hypothetical protein